MAVAEKVGFDRRGKTIYKRTPAGEDIVKLEEEIERIRVGDKIIERKLQRPKKILDDDLPIIAEKYHEFRQQYPEPG